MLVSTISPAPSCSTSFGPGDRFQPGADSPAVDMDFPDLAAVLLDPLRVDIHDDALAAEPPGRLADELGIADGGRIDRHLVAAGVQQIADVVDRADAAADGQRHEDDLGRAADHVEHDLPPFVAGRDIEKHEFVGPLALVARGDLDGIAGIAKVEEIRPLHDPPAVDIETGNNALGEHRRLVESVKRVPAAGSVICVITDPTPRSTLHVKKMRPLPHLRPFLARQPRLPRKRPL